MVAAMRVVFESTNRRACSDRALVLESLKIPYEIVDDAMSCALVVPAEFSARAAEELRLYDEENPARRPRRPAQISYQRAAPGLAFYITCLCVVAWLAGTDAFGRDWYLAGKVDGELIRSGELWRSVTALTLHADLKHLIGNIVFGIFFGLFAGRLLGSGVAWLAILVAAAAGNLLNTLLLTPLHSSVGASTAVFAALGLVAGHVWWAKLMRQDRWPYRVGPVVGGLALLMYTGTGGPNTDIGAHLMGFVSGFGAGVLLVQFRSHVADAKLQRYCGAAAAGLLAVCWTAALLL
jgi:membrane associated rhomboid family serine protease